MATENINEEKAKDRLLELYQKSYEEGLNLLEFQEGVSLLQTFIEKKIKV